MDNFQYYAFISYSRHDEQWATWLQKNLERYTLPQNFPLKAERKLPNHLRPVFRDKTDIGLGSLNTNLKRALEDSKYLIVVCSPRSAKSEWVNMEVEYFKSLGRIDSIIPFIVEGNPDDTDESKRCYPPALDKNIIGASLRELSREQALIKIVASLLGLKYDELYQRHLRQAIQRKRTMYAALAAIVISFLAAGFFYWDYNRIKYEYYTDYIEKWGIPEGLHALKSGELKVMNLHYRFEYQRGKLIRLVTSNSAGVPVANTATEHIDRPSIQQFYYRLGEKKIDYVDYLTKNGQLILRKEYSGDDQSVLDFTHADKMNKAVTLLASTSSLSTGFLGLTTKGEQRSDVSRHLIEWDQSGYVSRVFFMRDNRNTPISDANGIFGYAFVRDELGRMKEQIYLNKNGNSTENKYGVSKVKLYYDEIGHVRRTEFLNGKGGFALNDVGYAIDETIYDNNHNGIEGKFYGIDQKPVTIRGQNLYGYSIIRQTYDRNGFGTSISYFDVHDKPCYDELGTSVVKIVCDAKGNLRNAYSCDPNGRLITSKKGITEIRAEYDDAGNILSYRYYNKEAKPVLSLDGTGGWRVMYNDKGNITEYVLLDKDGSPTTDKTTFTSKTKYEYDSYGNLTGEYYYDKNGMPCLNNLGIAGINMKYNETGNCIEMSYVDKKNNLTIEKNSLCAKQVYERDSYGNLTTVKNYGANDKPCLNFQGLHAWISLYDDQGNLSEQRYFDTDMIPAYNQKTLTSIIRYEYNDMGHITLEKYFDINDKPALCNNGFFTLSNQYDKQGRIVERKFLDEKGNLCNSKEDGSARTIYGYDDRGNTIYIASYGTDNKLMLTNNKAAIIKTTYNERNLPVQDQWLGVNMEPCIIDRGYSIKKINYNEKGQLIGESYYDIVGKSCSDFRSVASCTVQYDEKGNEVAIAYFNTKGALSMLKPPRLEPMAQAQSWMNNYAKLENIYNEKSQLVRTLYYTESGKLSIYAENGPGIEYEFDNSNNLIRVTYLGTDLKPRATKGYATVRYEYNDRGQRTKEASFDESDRPCIGEFGSAMVEISYDQFGRRHESSYWDTNGKPKQIFGVSREVLEYDIRGNWTGQFFFGPDKKPTLYTPNVANQSHYASWTARYDNRDRLIEKRFYGTSGKLSTIREGYAIERFAYDARGKLVSISYFNPSDKPCLAVQGYSSTKYYYNSRGIVTEIRYFNAGGQPCEGIYRYKYIYDDSENLLQTIIYDKEGSTITQKHLIMAGEVYPGSAAALAGVKNGDYIYKWGQWVFDINAPFETTAESFSRALKEYQDQLKHIIIVRMNESGAGEVIPFTLSKGLAGIRVVDILLQTDNAFRVEKVYKYWKISNASQ